MKFTAKTFSLWLSCVLVQGMSGAAFAHKLAPSLLQLQQVAPQIFDVTWKTPRASAGETPATPVLPQGCSDLGAREVLPVGTGIRHRWRIQCDSALSGESLSVRGLTEGQSAVLVRLAWLDGSSEQAMLDAAAPSWTISQQTSSLQTFLNYLTLGVEHILAGFDHLLFVLGLLMLAANLRSLTLTITAFTLGHSITLALATLGYMTYPVSLVECAIALSIFLVAIELTRADSSRNWLRRWPWVVAIGFGLLHGMGFAGALQEVGLPSCDIPTALLAFNLGIETGQLVFVLTLLGLQQLWAKFSFPQWRAFYWAPVYLMGITSVYWSIERGVEAIGF